MVSLHLKIFYDCLYEFIGILLLGDIIAVMIPNKHQYNRLEYEKSVAEQGSKTRRASAHMLGFSPPVDPE